MGITWASVAWSVAVSTARTRARVASTAACSAGVRFRVRLAVMSFSWSAVLGLVVLALAALTLATWHRLTVPGRALRVIVLGLLAATAAARLDLT